MTTRVLPLLVSPLLGSAIHAQCELQKIHGVAVCDLDENGDRAIVRDGDTYSIYERTPFGWVHAETIAPPHPGAFDQNWGDGALDGDRLAIGDAGYFPFTTQAVYVYERSGPGSPYVLTAQLAPAQPSQWFTFGRRLDLEGDVLVVGSPEWGLAHGVGDAYVFELVGGTWIETLHVTGHGLPDSGSAMGEHVEVEDGIVFLGEHGGHASPFGTYPGGVHVYEKLGGTWTKTGFLPCGTLYCPGFSVDGDRIASVDFHGEVQILERVAGSWVESALVQLPAPGSQSLYPALSGGTLVVGDRNHDAGGESFGGVHLVREIGGAWTWQDLLQPEGFQGKSFGATVRLAGDHMLAAAGDAEAGVSAVATHAWSISGQGCPTLTSTSYVVDSATGGTQTLRLAAGAAHAGDLYLLAGSLSGFWPGTPIAGVTIPLNPDVYLIYTLFHGGSPPLSGHVGFLDANGEATASVVLPPDPLLAGLAAHHAFGVVDPALAVTHVSNPWPLLVQ